MQFKEISIMLINSNLATQTPALILSACNLLQGLTKSMFYQSPVLTIGKL